MFDQANPLNRIKDETARAHKAFMDYVEMPVGERSLPNLHKSYIKPTVIKPATKHLRTLLGWSTKYHWQARLAQDQANTQAERQAKLDAEFVERRKQQAKLELDAAQALYDKAMAILKTLPLVRSKATDDKGGAVTIEPASSREYNAARAMLKDASQLARLVIGLPQESVKRLEVFDWREEARKDGVDPSEVYERMVNEFSKEMARSGNGRGIPGGEAEK